MSGWAPAISEHYHVRCHEKEKEVKQRNKKMAEKNKMKIRRRLWAGLEQVEGMSICCDMSRFSGTLYSEEAFYCMNLQKLQMRQPIRGSVEITCTGNLTGKCTLMPIRTACNTCIQIVHVFKFEINSPHNISADDIKEHIFYSNCLVHR